MLVVLTGGDFDPQEHLAMSVGIFDCHDWDEASSGQRSGMLLDIMQ